ncbi:MAG: PIN domain-containing protein [Acidobacteria bacterium]|nr:PIN domain-containing protein [Acidobacteriota bacterium]
MGLILDTSIIVTAERRGHSVPEILAQVRRACGETEIGVSVVTIVELTHGIRRAKLEGQRQRREAFVEELMATMTMHPITPEIAPRAGIISGEETERGVHLPFEDLLIGATALQLGFAVATENVRHFQAIPGLIVRQL